MFSELTQLGHSISFAMRPTRSAAASKLFALEILPISDPEADWTLA